MANWIIILVKVGLGLGAFGLLALIFLTMVARDTQGKIYPGDYRTPRVKDRKHDKGQDGHQGADQGS